MEARLNRSYGSLSAGTRILVLDDIIPEYEAPDANVLVELHSPASKALLEIEPGANYPFDIEVDALTPCRPTVEYVPSENRHKRRAGKREAYALKEKE